MRKMLLVAVVITGFVALAAPKTSAAPVVGIYTVPTTGMRTGIIAIGPTATGTTTTDDHSFRWFRGARAYRRGQCERNRLSALRESSLPTTRGRSEMGGIRRILVIEDDAALRQSLSEFLAGEHRYVVVEAPTLAQADRVMDKEDGQPDAIVLDIGLPDGDGCDYCAKLRRAGFKMPIIILTGAAAEEDVVRGLAAGANDYIAKPFRSNELAARVQAQLRTFRTSSDATFAFGRFVFQPATRQLRDVVNKQVVRLTEKEVSVLRFLYRADGVVDRDVLLTQVWGYNSAVTTHTLETHIYRLRQKIEAAPSTPTLLITAGGGYRLEKS